MKTNTILIAAAVFAGGCCTAFRANSTAPAKDAEGFVWLSSAAIGRAAPSEPGDFYILRYEKDSTEDFSDWRREIGKKRIFTEVRQLKDSVTVLADGVLSVPENRIPGRNWRKWLPPMARNVRIKFVDAGYSIADDGRADAPEGFVSLFNGRDLSGWRGCTMEEKFHWPSVRNGLPPEKCRELQAKADVQMKDHWHVRDGALFFDGLEGGFNIAAAKDYGDFELVADWRLLRVWGDSGFYLRGLPQVQIWDPGMWNGLGSGGAWNNSTEPFAASVCADRPIGDWNRCRIRLVGDRLTVWLNGEKVVDGVKFENCREPGAPIPASDRLELQCHGDPVEFRNIFIKEL